MQFRKLIRVACAPSLYEFDRMAGRKALQKGTGDGAIDIVMCLNDYVTTR